jgi:hypothetical protein
VVANPNNRNTGHENSILPESDTFKLVAETRKQVNAVAAYARDAIKAHYTNPQSLADFIEQQQTPVYQLHGFFQTFCLWALGFEPGFIPPATGLRYQLLQRFFQLHTYFYPQEKQTQKSNCHFHHGVFVLTRPLFTVGFISHQLHHWLAFRSGMRGYCDRSQSLYRKFWSENQGLIGSEVYKMKAKDILALKAAINRDLEALQFLKQIADEILIPAKQARQISQGKASA